MSAPADPAVLLAGDWHGNLGHARWVVDRAVALGTDRIFQLGDFGFWEHEPAGVEFLDALQKQAARKKVTVYFLDGNHDKTSLLLEKYTDADDEGFLIVRPQVRYASRGHRWSWHGVSFMALGGAYSVDKAYRLRAEEVRDRPESLWFPEEEMSDADLDRFLDGAGPVDVLLAHDKPRSTAPLINRKEIRECWPNQDRLQRAVTALRPRLMVHGHLHYRYSDVIAIDERTACRVEGLDADPHSALGPRAGSYLLLSLAAPPERPEPPAHDQATIAKDWQ